MKINALISSIIALLSTALLIQDTLATITVQIGNGLRISTGGSTSAIISQPRIRDNYRCYWDCDLVGCQLTRHNDECAYDCEKVCKPRFDYMGRSDVNPSQELAAGSGAESELKPKSANGEPVSSNEIDQTGEFPP